MQSANHAVEAPGPSRRWWGVLLVISFLWLGLLAGMALGARFFVPAGSGMAGPATALYYGLEGAVVCGLLSGLVIRKLEARQLRFLALVCATLSILSFAYIVTVVMQKQAAIRRERAPTRPLVPTELTRPIRASPRLPP